MLSTGPGTGSSDHGHLLPSHTAVQEQAGSRSPSAHHSPSALPSTARAPFSWGHVWWQQHGLVAGSPITGQGWWAAGHRTPGRSSWTRGLERPTLRDFLLRKPLTGARQPVPKETQKGRRSQEETSGGGGGGLAFPGPTKLPLVRFIQPRYITPPHPTSRCHHGSGWLDSKHPAKRH